MKTSLLSCAEAKKLDLVDYLSSLGFQPEKIVRENYWYLSPLREEKHASFKINRKKNIWYDFGTGEGGTIIDFGIRYHRCTISELLEKLKTSFSFHPPYIFHHSKPAGQKKKIEVIAWAPITNPALCRYLNDRNIPLELAQKYCKEVHYSLNGRHYFAIGFKNNSGGFELRNAHFKGSISPKDVTVFSGKNLKEIAVFEGFFSFLSYLKFQKTYPSKLPDLHTNFLILNSLSFFKKSRKIMEKFAAIHLYLDRDTAGRKCTEKALKWSSRFKDCSGFYRQNKDMNEWFIQQENGNILKANLPEKNANKHLSQKPDQRFDPSNRKRIKEEKRGMEEEKMIRRTNTKRIIISHKKGRGI